MVCSLLCVGGWVNVCVCGNDVHRLLAREVRRGVEAALEAGEAFELNPQTLRCA